MTTDELFATRTFGRRQGESVRGVTVSARTATEWEQSAKRVLDVVGGLFGLVILLPVLLTAALLVKMTSPGPAFYRQERVGRWTWRDETVRSLIELRKLASEDLSATILRVHLDITVSIAEHDEVDGIVRLLTGTLASHGRAAAVITDRTKLRIEASLSESDFDAAPDTVREVAAALKGRAGSCEKSRRALIILHRLLSEER